MKKQITNGNPLPCPNCKTADHLVSVHEFGVHIKCDKCHLSGDSVGLSISSDPRASDWDKWRAVDAWNLKMKELQGVNKL